MALQATGPCQGLLITARLIQYGIPEGRSLLADDKALCIIETTGHALDTFHSPTLESFGTHEMDHQPNLLELSAAPACKMST